MPTGPRLIPRRPASGARALHLAASLLAVVLTACSSIVPGAAVQTPLGVTALPTAAELAAVLKLPIQVEVVGKEGLQDQHDTSVPADCAGVARAGERQTFPGIPPRSVAVGKWQTPQGGSDQTSVVIAVAELDAPASARSEYARLAVQWRRCQHAVVTQRADPALKFVQDIGGVIDSDEVLSTDVLVSTADGLMTPLQNRRVLTAAGRCLIDVEILGPAGVAVAPVRASDAVTVAEIVARRVEGR